MLTGLGTCGSIIECPSCSTRVVGASIVCSGSSASYSSTSASCTEYSSTCYPSCIYAEGAAVVCM